MMRISGSDLHHFRVFDSVVRNNGISAAQMELSLSQPTISNHLTALEERLGVKLCERGRRGFVLTEKGRIVHSIGLEIMRSLDAQSHRLTSLRDALIGRVRLGVVDCVASDRRCRVSDVLAMLVDTAPAIEISLNVARSGDIAAGIAQGRLDIGIGSFDARLDGFDYAPLYAEEHRLYCGASDPLFTLPDPEITKAVCYQRPWVTRGYQNTRNQRSLQCLKAHAVIYDIESQLMTILSGAYIGLLPLHYAQRFVDEGRLRQLPMREDDYCTDIEVATRAWKIPRSVAYVRKLICESHASHL